MVSGLAVGSGSVFNLTGSAINSAGGSGKSVCISTYLVLHADRVTVSIRIKHILYILLCIVYLLLFGYPFLKSQ